MKTLSRLTLTLAALAVLAAIWSPYGDWWQWAITALLLLLTGAALAGQTTNTPTTEPEETSTLERITDNDVTNYKRQYGQKADQ